MRIASGFGLVLLRHPGTERISAESPQMAPVDLECLSLSTTLGAFVVMAGVKSLVQLQPSLHFSARPLNVGGLEGPE